MYLSRRGSLAKSGAGDQATRIDVRLKGVAEIVSSALGGSIVGKVKGCVCVCYIHVEKVKVNFHINLYKYVTPRVYIFARAMHAYMYTYRSLLF